MTATVKATLVWMVLLMLSALSAYVGETGKASDTIILLIVFTLIVKGQLVVDYFMQLRHVQLFWRTLMSAFCVVIGCVIYITFHLAQP